MSSFTTIKTEIHEEKTLRDVIDQLGYVILENKELKGYGETYSTVDFQVVVPNGHNIGFRKVDRTYQMISDHWRSPNIRTMERDILQGYASKIVMRNVTAMGYTMVTRTIDKNNSIKLVLVKQ